ncbi:hypothetical protein LOD99_8158 [Oopsacas minuta]|uniref:EIF2B subunit epsilon/gamma LbH domain-containing protein n=1 Tax=Oopsacas minuta TaxID=111878 RepID=A0AAV7JI30_9METZ|nr:hypothetical protein LOD99_8158 [Oopsacas minuta]
MSKKGSKKGGGEGSKSEQISEPTLQAVLLIDCYNLYFSPLSSNYPLCLFPVANEPILSYTLYFLRSAGIQELLIVGKHCSKELGEFIKNFMLIQKGAKLSIHSLFSETCDSLGSCLKHVHSSQLIHSDFVLLYGCVISNVDVLEIIKEHRTRTKNNPGSMMTMVFQRGAPQQRGRTQENDLALMISQNEKQLLFYQKTGYRNKLKFPLDKILSHNSVELHYDIQETCLFICSPQVPQLFSENFDYQTIEDFINGILVDEELLSNQIHTHILDGRCYLSSASTPLAYHCINTDAMERWTYPYVPDSNLKLSPGDKYEYSRRNIYIGTCVTLERGSRLEVNVVIGKLCHIHSGASITHSVLGDNVVVGEHVKIEDSYIWSNVTIHDNCTITGCIIANDVIIKSRCSIGSSSFISRGLTIGPDIKLSPGTRLIQRIEPIQTHDELSSSDRTPTLGSDFTPLFTHSLAQDIVNIGKYLIYTQTT